MEGIKLDKKKTALVVIDLQKGIANSGRNTAPNSVKTVIDNAVKLADAFRLNGMQVILVHVKSTGRDRLNVISDTQFSMPGKMPDDWADIVPELGPKEEDIVVTKKQWGAFYGTDLELQLRRRGIDTIVLCGISTNHGVESTARFAYELGFQQIFAEDAMSAMSEDAHRTSIETAFKLMGRVRSTEEIISVL
ncbi:MAG: hydrolase [Candidatus Marsarchaeota archaeon]|jgi:nicotinamidase-related amidase|nr:hydrolase [Candidatus Marsarchaeota archaeon]